MNQLAIITGASRGIGKAIAHKFAEKGCDLILCCHKNAACLSNFAAELEKTFSIKVSCFHGNLAEPSFVERLFEGVSKIDYLVNNAGISLVKLLTDTTYEEWQEIFGTNMTSMFLTSKEAVKKMLPYKEGRILNISSMWGQSGASMEVAYSASKGAVDAFTKALAKELAPSGICVNALSFGFIDTEMNAHLSKEEREAFFEEIPMGRPGSPEEAAQMAYQILTSPSYLTGQVIRMDGGLL